MLLYPRPAWEPIGTRIQSLSSFNEQARWWQRLLVGFAEELALDAQEAAHCLNVPVYLLTHPEERVRLGIPHYRVGKLVRFKLHELMVWIESQQRFRRDPSQGGIDA